MSENKAEFGGLPIKETRIRVWRGRGNLRLPEKYRIPKLKFQINNEEFFSINRYNDGRHIKKQRNRTYNEKNNQSMELIQNIEEGRLGGSGG